MSLFDIVINIFEQTIIFCFIAKYSSLNDKYKPLILPVFILVGSFLMTFSNMFFGFEGLFKFVFITIDFIFCLIYCKNSLVEKIFVSIYPYVLISVINDLLTIVLSFIMFNTINYEALASADSFVYIILTSKVLLIVCLIITIKFRKRYDKFITNSEMIYLMSLIILVQIMFIFIEELIYSNEIKQIEIVLIAIIITIFMLGIVFNFFVKLRQEDEEKTKLLNLQMINFEEKRYYEMKKMCDNTAKLKHNLKHVLINVKNKLNTKDINDAKYSIELYLQEINEINVYGNFDSPVLDFLINKAVDESTAKNYDLKYTVNLGREVNISDNDYMILIGNAIENAIEHSKGLRQIDVTIQQKNEFALYKISNTINKDFDFEKFKFSSKGIGHGYGVKSMIEIAEKNKGHISFNIEGDILVCSILIPLI
ncbi:GHKL domain-containing protein [Anaerorhabdus sp.]|uniref:GHKL domain-containing protein n=2 Tax=Anaerorhabdus sp. TaxID=1872524 RepID=UPI002FCC0709